MGIFGGTTRQVLEYTIHLTDEKLVHDLQAADNANVPGDITKMGFDVHQIQAPIKAAAQFGVPITVAGTTFTPPGITSPWFTNGANFPLGEDSFKRKSGGWFGISFLFGTTVLYYWRRLFVYEAANGASGAGDGSGDGNAGTTDPPLPTPISNRRWVDGFELQFTAEGGVDAAQIIQTRDASRHVDGLGMAVRDSVATTWHRTHTLTNIVGGGPYTVSWERFYIRLRKFPSAAAPLWRSHSSPSPNQGIYLQIGPAGEIIVNSSDPTSVLTQHGSAGVLVLNTWTRIDLLLQQAGAASYMGRAGASFKVFINGGLPNRAPNFDIAAPSGLGGTSHTTSDLGIALGAANGIEYDVDDWINADLPTITATPPDTNGIITDPSWFAGSRCRLVRPTGITLAGAWSLPVTGWRVQLEQFPEATPGLTQSSTTSGDTIAYSTDAARSVDALPGQVGVGAFIIALFNMASGAANGRFGWKFAGGAPTLVANDNPITNLAWTQALYNSGVANPPALAGLELYIEHSASVQTEQQAGFFLEAEVLGYWGNEDPRALGSTTVTPTTTPIVASGMNGVHNAPFPYTPWATAGVMAPATVTIYGGTYVGDGAPHDLAFTAPIHWLWIRPLSGTIEGARWFSSMVGAHQRYNDSPSSSLLPDVLVDPDFPPAAAVDAQEMQCLVRLLANAQTNAVGVTYQYIAVSDAAMRFMMNGAFAHKHGDVGPFDNAIWNAKWTAQAGFFWQENPITGDTGVAPQLWYKGVGHAVAAASLLNSAESASFGDFLLGIFRSRLSAHNQISTGVAYNLWRRDDKSQDPGIPRVVQLVSYVGDGSGSRVINLAPLSGRRPLFCVVTPHNATVALYRDPSHTGTTSSQINNVTNAATGITAGGIDTITVNTALNANGIVYDVFVLPGDTVAGNAGWSINGTFIPVMPGVGGDPGGIQLTDFVDFEGDNPYTAAEAGTVESDLSTDLEAACLPLTHKIINIALSRIGVTTQVSDLSTELTAEAAQGRLHFTADAAATLRDFPWAFATRYADPLTLVRGKAWSSSALVQAWSVTATYSVGDVVRYGGTVFYCLTANTAAVPVNGSIWSSAATAAPDDANEDWLYAYRVPTNMVLARRIVRPGSKRLFDPNPPPFRIGQDINGDLIYTDEQDAILEYTFRPPCAAGAGDALFRDALAWRLAHSFAAGLSKDAKKQAYCWQMYLFTLTRAEVPNANEQERQDRTGGDADWIQGRN